ncbi:putative reverse transcriptase domain-containing protein [Tanacetum coccineum]|uniref:Reverse transcriptase domain-containing protein n=1 Tax=Tanacetum coccineum TaxID=301880 RepID=A0ABQ5BJA1_9ASTR
MRQRRWIELFSDYDCEIQFTILCSIIDKILAAQKEAPDESIGLQRGLDELIERRSDEELDMYGGQNEKGIAVACMFDFGGSWDVHLLLVEFSYNDSHHSSMRCAPFEALYGRKCRSQGQLIGSELVQETTERISQIKDRLKAALDRQKSYADKRRKPLGGQVLVHKVLAQVSPCWVWNKSNIREHEGNYFRSTKYCECFNAKGRSYVKRQCFKQKRKRMLQGSGKRVLLVGLKGVNGKVLTEEELEFLADPGVAEAKAVLMANLSSYGSDVLSEDIIDNAVQMSNAATIASGMYNLDPVILAPKVKNNREAHEYYRVKPCTGASRLKPSGNTKNDRILRTLSSYEKNKIMELSSLIKLYDTIMNRLAALMKQQLYRTLQQNGVVESTVFDGFIDFIQFVMVISVISVSSDLLEESAGTSTGRVILFGNIPTTIPDTTPSVIPPSSHIDTVLTPTSPDYTPASFYYSPAYDTEFDPSEDPLSDHIPPLPAILPFLLSTDDSSESDTRDTPPSPTHDSSSSSSSKTSSDPSSDDLSDSSSHHSLPAPSSELEGLMLVWLFKAVDRVGDVMGAERAYVRCRVDVSVTHPVLANVIPGLAQAEGSYRVSYDT